MTKAQQKTIRVNQTDETVPGVGVPQQADPEMSERIIQKTREQLSEDALYNTASQITDQAAPATSAAQVIEAAEQADDVQAWEKVADMLYELEHKKHTLPGLMQSRLGRLLERLP